jgi:hypothetical protein
VSAESKEPRLEHVQETEACTVSALRRPSTPPDDPSPTTISCGAKKSKEPLGTDDFDVLKEMVQAYKAQRLDFSVLPRRPRFKSPRVNTGITLSDEIRRRSLEQALSDPDGTGGSLSSLIELLLWVFLECPHDVVERYPR